MKKSAGNTTSSQLTAAQRRKLAALAAQPDDKIQYSNIPPMTDKFWEKCRPQPVLPAGEKPG